jgi:hypothetical protein
MRRAPHARRPRAAPAGRAARGPRRAAAPPPPAASAGAARAFGTAPLHGSRAPPHAAPAPRPPGVVAVAIEQPSLSSSRLVASTAVAAPPEAVWSALTDYERLGTFIPSLVENRCLTRTPRGAVLYQVGAQDLALGLKFSAACTLEVTEHAGGAPHAHFAPPHAAAPAAAWGGSPGWGGAAGAAGAARLPWPSQALPGQPVFGDVTFDLAPGPAGRAGDFDAFRGVWRVQAVGGGGAWLTYALFVRPRALLPVALVAQQIGEQVRSNLAAVARHSEQRARSGGGFSSGGGAAP